MENLDITKSILNELEEEDIQEIYFDYLRMKEGYVLNYVIDADEIHDYCLPFDKNIDKDLGEIADEQFVIQYLFGTKESKVIIVDDYLEELNNLQDNLLSTINAKVTKEAIQKYIGTLKDFLKKIDNLRGESEDYLEEVQKSYSFLLSISDGNYKIILSDLNNLISKSSVIEGVKDDKVISKSLKGYETDIRLINSIYKDFEHKSISKYNDIHGILKAYHLTKSYEESNKVIKDKKKERKELFYFISSSTVDIKKLRLSILKNKIEYDQFCFGFLAKGRSSLIRTKSQIFAFLVYRTGNEDIDDSQKKPLKYVDFKNEIFRSIKKWDASGEHKELADKLKLGRSINIEKGENLTIHLNRQNQKYEFGNNSTLKKDNFDKLLSYSTIYGNELKKSIEELISKSTVFLENEFGKTNLNEVFERIRMLKKISRFENEVIETFLKGLNKSKLEFDRGEDPIESIFNAFPPLFEYTFYKKNFFPVLEKIEKEQITSQDVIKLISQENIHRDFYISVIYLLLLVKYKYPRGNYNSNFIAYSNIKILLKKKKNEMNNSRGRLGINSNKNIKDLYALGCWAARRSRCYRLAYELSMEARKMYMNDPRFSHSLALIGFCWKYEYGTTGQYDWPYSNEKNVIQRDYFIEQDKDYVEEIISKNYFTEEGNDSVIGHCEDGIQKYKDMGVGKNKNYEYILNSYVALLNLTAFVYVIKYKLLLKNSDKNKVSSKKDFNRKKDHDFLIKARRHVLEMRNLFAQKKGEQKWKNYPAYLHTEVFLEYYELRDQMKIEVIKSSFETKLSSAKRDIDYAIKKSKERTMLYEKCKILRENLLGLEIEKRY